MEPVLIPALLKALAFLNVVTKGQQGSECGRFGTEHQTKAEFPWLAKIYREKSQGCMGSLISRDFVVTAGVCGWDFKRKSNLESKVFNVTFDTYGNGPQVNHSVEETILLTRPGEALPDIALLRIKPLDTQEPVCLPRPDQTFEGQTGTFVRFQVGENGCGAGKSDPCKDTMAITQECPRDHLEACTTQPDLHPGVSHKLCGRPVTKSRIGVPLMVEVEGLWTLAGVASGMVRCDKEEAERDLSMMPTKFQNITHSVDWIRGKINQ